MIQRLKHNKERNFLAFSIEDFISSHSYKSLILDSIFNRFFTRINNFLVKGRSFCVLQNLLNQDVSHSFDMLVAIIWPGSSFVATRVGVITVPSSAEPDSGVAAVTIILLVTNDTNSRFAVCSAGTYGIESLFVTVGL